MSPPLVPAPRRAALHRRLLAWWDAGHRDLPWRYPQHGADPYRVWLAEVMLQQTQVATATPYFRRFVERWPTLAALAAAPDEEVFAAWSGLGYYARCRNLLAAARAAVARHGGLPASLEALAALPGFGPYTAGAVASIAFAVPAAAVDGNVARVLARVFLEDGAPEERTVRGRLWALAGALVHPERPGDWNQGLMELGATVCTPRSPGCARCPLAPCCAARRAGVEREVPAARRRPERRTIVLACAAVVREGRALLIRRPASKGLFAGLLALPSVELTDGVDARHALSAALRDELGLDVRVGDELGAVERVLTHRLLTLRAFACRPVGRRASAQGRWVELAALAEAGMPAAMRALVPLLVPCASCVGDSARIRSRSQTV